MSLGETSERASGGAIAVGREGASHRTVAEKSWGEMSGYHEKECPSCKVLLKVCWEAQDGILGDEKKSSMNLGAVWSCSRNSMQGPEVPVAELIAWKLYMGMMGKWGRGRLCSLSSSQCSQPRRVLASVAHGETWKISQFLLCPRASIAEANVPWRIRGYEVIGSVCFLRTTRVRAESSIARVCCRCAAGRTRGKSNIGIGTSI